MAPKTSKYKKYLKVKRSNAGLGLFSTSAIPRGSFIIEYTGELISHKEADLRGGKYLFELNSRFTVDGKGRNNLARYINHSCRPNAEVEIKGRNILIYSRRNIKEGEEITYDYGKEYFNEFIKPYGCRCNHCTKSLHKKSSDEPVR